MTDSTAGFFEGLGLRGHEPLLENAKGSLRFELADGDRTDRWFVTIDRGDVSVSRKNSRADCVVRGEKTLFDAIARGEVNGMAAYLRGELTLEGNPELMVLIQRVLPGPANHGSQAGSAGGRSDQR
jgi:putative sterol carrier protein